MGALFPHDHELEAARFRFKGQNIVFHFKTFYRMLYHMMREEEYGSMDGDDDKWGFEIFYYLRETQARGRDNHIWWRLQKQIKNNSYYRRRLNIDIKTLNIKDIEVMQHGIKYQTQQGEIEVEVTAILELDWKKQWRDHWFLKNIEEWYWRGMGRHDFERHRIRLYREAHRFQHKMKMFLQLGVQGEGHDGKAWYPVRGGADEELPVQ
ncbi:hypothetical protein HZB02_07190 [Candidatus Woesearchaeota archaeon]|nr:hypothetical protein [Candidatus Woesearchaeota archaeon]